MYQDETPRWRVLSRVAHRCHFYTRTATSTSHRAVSNDVITSERPEGEGPRTTAPYIDNNRGLCTLNNRPRPRGRGGAGAGERGKMALRVSKRPISRTTDPGPHDTHAHRETRTAGVSAPKERQGKGSTRNCQKQSPVHTGEDSRGNDKSEERRAKSEERRANCPWIRAEARAVEEEEDREPRSHFPIFPSRGSNVPPAHRSLSPFWCRALRQRRSGGGERQIHTCICCG